MFASPASLVKSDFSNTRFVAMTPIVVWVIEGRISQAVFAATRSAIFRRALSEMLTKPFPSVRRAPAKTLPPGHSTISPVAFTAKIAPITKSSTRMLAVPIPDFIRRPR